MLMLTTVLIAGAVTSTPVRVEKPHVHPCPTVEVRKAGASRPPHRLVFPVRQAGDLEFVLSYPSKLSGQRVALKLLTPSGHLYQALNATLAAPRHHHASPETILRLPVSGTLVERSSLYGEWRAGLFLDGSSTACRRPLRFTLTR
jgi:hypothetical protein